MLLMLFCTCVVRPERLMLTLFLRARQFLGCLPALLLVLLLQHESVVSGSSGSFCLR